MESPLHVTNGDVAAERIRQAAVGGEILPWRDALHDGPVPADLDDEALREARAVHLADGEPSQAELIRADLAARDAGLEAARDGVVLWFEHDLYDQLQLIQVLDRLDGRRSDVPVEAVDPPTYLGMLDPDVFRYLFDLRDEVPPPAFALARSAWAAFRSPDPTAIVTLLAGDVTALPHLELALRRHLEEFPSAENGLSRTERQALEAIAGGASTLREAYHAAHHAREEAIYLGDLGFVTVLRRLHEVPAPLVNRVDGGSLRELVSQDGGGSQIKLWTAGLALTETGEAVLAGEADHVERNGVDRWLGGVHLTGREAAWRWDASAAGLIRGG